MSTPSDLETAPPEWASRPDPGWYPDPGDPTNWAWWDGATWLNGAQPSSGFEFVETAETAGTAETAETAEDRDWFPELRAMRLPAAIVAFGSTVLIVAMNVVGGGGETDATKLEWWQFVIGLASLAFMAAGIPLLAWACSRFFGSRSFTRDLGFRIRWIDLPLGVAAAAVMWGVSIGVVLLTKVIGLPQGSNTDAIADQMKANPDTKFILFLLILATAAVLAPLAEEMLFRGMLFRGLAGRLPMWAAIGVQGVVFGSAHFIPSLGWSNISLFLVLSSLGLCLGFTARLTGRLSAGIIGHSLFNASQLVVLYITL